MFGWTRGPASRRRRRARRPTARAAGSKSLLATIVDGFQHQIGLKTGAVSDARVRLVDLGIDSLVMGFTVRRSPRPPDPGTIRANWARQRAAFEAGATAATYNEKDVRSALFALAAFIDESMIANDDVRARWLDQGLISESLDDAKGQIAGVRFFERLQQQLPATGDGCDVVEVHDACLRLGFRGMMGSAEREQEALDLQARLAAEIQKVRGGGPEDLGAQSRWRPEPPGQVHETPPAWVIPAVIGCGIVLSYLMIWIIAWLAAGHVNGQLEGKL